MRRIALVLCVLALPAFADEKPDYSRDSLNRLFVQRQIDLPPRPEGRVQWHFGFVEFRALGMNWRVIYLPILMPLAGSGMQNAAKLPDPIALANAPAANAHPVVMETSAEVQREVRRVRRRTGL